MEGSAHHNSRIRLFGDPRLERLTVVSAPTFVVLWAVLLPALALTAALTAPSFWALPLIGAGLFVWTGIEYALHRFVFHFEPTSPALEKLIFLIHGNHHADPNDPLRNLMPPIVSIPVGLTVWGAALLVLGPGGTWFTLGFMIGYVVYDLVHYACHQRPMKGPVARMLKTHHMRHHHARANGNYAITGMMWDRLLATRITRARREGEAGARR